MTTHTPEQICRAAFPQARVFPASELAPEWVGAAIELGQITYVVYGQDTDGWNLDTLRGDEAWADYRPTLAACLGAILEAHVAATFSA